jgi:hypothetical protein
LLRLLRHKCHRLKAVDGGDLNIDYMNNMYTAIQSWIASLSSHWHISRHREGRSPMAIQFDERNP